MKLIIYFIMQSSLSEEIGYANYLYSIGFIPGSQACFCGSKAFSIYKDSYSKTSLYSFRVWAPRRNILSA